MHLRTTWRSSLALAAGVLLLAGCATTGGTRTASAADPLEPMNRAFFQVHDVIDKVILKPVVTVYSNVIPRPARTAVSNFFGNIDDGWSFINDVLQGKGQKAGDDLGRVIMNTGFGLGGLIDVASGAGIEKGNEDLGQTLAVWGVGAGPYLFVPVYGPTTARDGVGAIARGYATPIGYLESVELRNTLFGLYVLDQRYQAGDALSVVETAALDRYTFIRNAYLQRRRYLIYDGKVPADKEE